MKTIKLRHIDKLQGPLSELCIAHGLTTLQSLLNYLQHLPYGRCPSRHDFTQIFKNKCGTCSSKHALVKSVSDENGWSDVELMLVMYKMHPDNTPGLKKLFNQIDLSYIPEAHCCLKIDGEMIDITKPHSDYNNIIKDVLELKSIQPNEIIHDKVAYHQAYIKNWITDSKIPFNFETVWNWREACILSLSQ